MSASYMYPPDLPDLSLSPPCLIIMKLQHLGCWGKNPLPRENIEVQWIFRENVRASLAGEPAKQVRSGFEMLALWLLSSRA